MAELWQPGPGSPRGDNKADVNPRHGKADLRPQRPGLRPCSSTTKEAHPFFWSFREEKVPKDEWQSWAIGGDPGEGRKGQSWPSDPWGGWGERIQAKQLALEASWRWGGNLGHGWLWDTQVTKSPHHCQAITIIHKDKNFFWGKHFTRGHHCDCDCDSIGNCKYEKYAKQIKFLPCTPLH